VTGAAWLQSGQLDGSALVYSLPISAWVAAILLINEVPDIAADEATGKHTLPVRFGLSGTSVIYVLLHALALAAVIQLALTGGLPVFAPLLPLGLMVLAARAAAAIRVGVAEREQMTKAIESTLAIHTLGSLWLTGIAVYMAIW
jgi:1,4-dihydroxy-2-naphthoate octaprenyltransferase